jgi:hypothetical protein
MSPATTLPPQAIIKDKDNPSKIDISNKLSI